MIVKYIDCMFNDSFTGNLEKLLGSSKSGAGTNSASQYHRNISVHTIIDLTKVTFFQGYH